jgi:hypothetical protein
LFNRWRRRAIPVAARPFGSSRAPRHARRSELPRGDEPGRDRPRHRHDPPGGDTWPGGNLNTPDHRAVGRSAIDAVADAGNRWLFPEPGLDPWNGVRWVGVFGSPEAGHAVDIGATFDRAVASLQAHAAYLAALGGPSAEEFLRGSAEQAAAHLPGVTLAAAFELVPTA